MIGPLRAKIFGASSLQTKKILLLSYYLPKDRYPIVIALPVVESLLEDYTPSVRLKGIVTTSVLTTITTSISGYLRESLYTWFLLLSQKRLQNCLPFFGFFLLILPSLLLLLVYLIYLCSCSWLLSNRGSTLLWRRALLGEDEEGERRRWENCVLFGRST